MNSDLWVRWLHIQWHRAEIARLLKTGAHRGTSEIARRMDAIALLCDCGRTDRGRLLVESLARDGGIGLNLSDSEIPS